MSGVRSSRYENADIAGNLTSPVGSDEGAANTVAAGVLCLVEGAVRSQKQPIKPGFAG